MNISNLRVTGRASEGEQAFTASVGATFVATTFIYHEEPVAHGTATETGEVKTREMLRKLVILFSLAIALVLSVAAQAAFQQPRPGQPPPPPEQEPPPAMAVPPSYRFDPSGRRDPFVNPVPKPKPETLVPIIRPKVCPVF